MIGTYRIVRHKGATTYRPYVYKAQYLKWGFWWVNLKTHLSDEPIINARITKELEKIIKAHAILKSGNEVERYSFDHELFKELTNAD